MYVFNSIKMPELVRFDGALVRGGVLGGSSGSLYQRWMIGGSMYDPLIHDLISYDRFLQLKRTFKLCINYIFGVHTPPYYNPTYKYDLIFKCLVDNCNAMTKYEHLICPRAYIHCHKLHTKYSNFTKGQNECELLLELI